MRMKLMKILLLLMNLLRLSLGQEQLHSDPDQLNCGDSTSSTETIAGPQRDPRHWPWMASLGYNLNKKWVHECGATLISSNHFLTAAHCLANFTNWKIHVGDFNLIYVNNNPVGRDVQIKTVIKHGDYTGKSAYFDVAVIETETVEFSDTIRPICLPIKPGTKRDHFQVDVLGWGAEEVTGRTSNILNLAVQVVYPNEYCNQTHKREGPINDRIKKVVPDLFQSQVLCAGAKSRKQGACKGDSGGPLQFYDPLIGRYFQVGIVHGSVGECGSTEWSTVYANLDDPVVLAFVRTAVAGVKNDSISSDVPLQEDEYDKDEVDKNVPDSDWHLVGSEGQKFELFNWKTREQCFVTDNDMNYDRSITAYNLLKNVPIFCRAGGRGCHKFVSATRQWVNISSIPFKDYYRANVVVPGMGLVIFGHDSFEKVTTLILDEPDGEWKVGPEISVLGYIHCALQLNETTTAIIHGRSISFYDWSTSSLNVRKGVFNSSNGWSTSLGQCVAMKDEIGNDLVVTTAKLSGTMAPHLAIWNPANENLYPEPIPSGARRTLDDCSIIAINDGKELLLYGFDENGHFIPRDIIRKFNYASKTWSDIGIMLETRRGPMILPVHGLRC